MEVEVGYEFSKTKVDSLCGDERTVLLAKDEAPELVGSQAAMYSDGLKDAPVSRCR